MGYSLLALVNISMSTVGTSDTPPVQAEGSSIHNRLSNMHEPMSNTPGVLCHQCVEHLGFIVLYNAQ